MRVLIGLGVAAAILAADVAPSSAQNRPWCLREGFSGPGHCGYDTYAQCYASARGLGGTCIENYMLAWQRQKARQQQQPRRRSQSDDWRR